jgi:dTDP-4-dehydrorhamnose 3,5-epimerase
MEYIRTAIPEVVLIKPQVFGDHRGFFLETFRQSEFDAFCGHQDFVQDNHSGSARVPAWAAFSRHQTLGKLVRAAIGEVFDVL